MINASLFRALIIFAVIALVIGAISILMPTASAQLTRGSSQPKPASSTLTLLDSMDDSLILLNSARIDVRAGSVEDQQNVSGFAGKQMHLVRFRGPIRPEWLQSLIDQGFEIVDYVPNYTYLVYGNSGAVSSVQAEALRSSSSIQWEGSFKEAYRISPDVFFVSKETGEKTLSSDRFQVQLYKDPPTNAETLGLIESIKTSPVRGRQEILHYVNLVVGLDRAGIDALASRPDVISIHRYLEPKKLDERQDIILTGNLTGNSPTPGDYLAYLTGKGFTQSQFDASGFLVDLTDSGIDNGTMSPNHFVFHRSGDPAQQSRVAYNRLEGTPNGGSTLQGCDGHGNLNASIIAGYVPGGSPFNAFPHADASMFRYGLGVAPFVKLGSSVIFDPNNYTFPDFAELQSQAYHDGARISSNSWGADVNFYGIDSQAYDALVRDAQPDGSPFANAGNQEMVILFSAGNAGENGSHTVGSPGTAKNVITVGASENVQAFGGADQCGTLDSEANNASDIVAFSSRGPTSDQRVKPDIMLPGTHISGAVGQQNATIGPVSGAGLALNCFNAAGGANGVCGGPGTSNFFPLSQQWYTASSGTSHSTPAVAGLSALIRQDFINKTLNPPSPAMTKGIMMNSAVYMSGVGANDTLPSNNQGMGLASLNNYFSIFSGPHVLMDEQDSVPFTSSGQERTITGTVVDNTKPFRVTLAWTDAPGSTVGNAFVNDLDLEVTVGGNTYLGNVFTGGNSSTGGIADSRNNVESVFLPAGISGNFVIRVKAHNIGGDGIPGNAAPLDQDFALIASNAAETPVSVVESNGVAIVAEDGEPANNVPDPGETVTVNLTLHEVGSANSATVTATLQNSGGIVPITTTQNFGVLSVGGPLVSQPFTFKVPSGAACGSQITLTFQIQDGLNISTITKTFELGIPAAPFGTQNFDGVAAPALPGGWTNVQFFGSSINWQTSASNPASAPNSASAGDPSTINAAGLISPVIAVRSTSAILTFQNSFNTEASSTDPTLGYDGMVLEVRIGNDVFQDIFSAGGTFVSGGYNRAISGEFGNAIAGRPAWSGNSGGYITTAVNLPASANGHDVQFRWIMASDDGTSGVGVKIDNVSITGGFLAPNACSAAPSKHVRADFDGDGRTDVSVYRPGDNSMWFAIDSGGGFLVEAFGTTGDIVVPGDYDGDGKADAALYRPSSGSWFVLRSSDSTVDFEAFGLPTDIPAEADYDGDGKTDIAVYRPDSGTWFVWGSQNGQVSVVNFGLPTDKPVPADYDGDGKADIAVYRPDGGSWFVLRSSDQAVDFKLFGLPTDIPAPGDYDGDGRTDIALYRPDSGSWFILRSSDQGVTFVPWGISTDIPTPGDYDGDGKDDVAVFRPDGGGWFIIGSTSGVQVTFWGISGDVPIPAKYIP